MQMAIKIDINSIIRNLLIGLMFINLHNAFVDSSDCERTLRTEVICPSEKCFDNRTVVNLVHIEARGSNDTVHFLYSTYGIPSVLIARTRLQAKLVFDADKFLNSTVFSAGSIRFSEEPSEMFILMISDVIDYIDTKDTANMQELNYTKFLYNLGDAEWDKAVTHTNDSSSHHVIFRILPHSTVPPLKENGTFALKFQVHCDAGFADQLPHLQYNANMSVADVILDDIAVVSNSSRLALNLILLATTSSEDKGNMTIVNRRTIDDEHSPGSFVLVNWLTGSDFDHSKSFVEWKPVCYNEPQRSIESISISRYYELKRFRFDNATRCLAFDYFGVDLLNRSGISISSTNISFGIPGDKFYEHTAYTAWSFSLGFGSPPEDQISPTIILIIVIGLGIPAALILFSFAYTCWRKIRRHDGYVELNSEYSEIN